MTVLYITLYRYESLEENKGLPQGCTLPAMLLLYEFALLAVAATAFLCGQDKYRCFLYVLVQLAATLKRKFSSLAASEVVLLITSGAVGYENDVAKMNLDFSETKDEITSYLLYTNDHVSCNAHNSTGQWTLDFTRLGHGVENIKSEHVGALFDDPRDKRILHMSKRTMKKN